MIYSLQKQRKVMVGPNLYLLEDYFPNVILFHKVSKIVGEIVQRTFISFDQARHNKPGEMLSQF